MWGSVIKQLKESDSIGTELLLRCEKHPKKYTFVATASDFSVSE